MNNVNNRLDPYLHFLVTELPPCLRLCVELMCHKLKKVQGPKHSIVL